MSLFVSDSFQNFVSKVETFLRLNFLGSLEQNSIELSD
jgi:hypothetical protein